MTHVVCGDQGVVAKAYEMRTHVSVEESAISQKWPAINVSRVAIVVLRSTEFVRLSALPIPNFSTLAFLFLSHKLNPLNFPLFVSTGRCAAALRFIPPSGCPTASRRGGVDRALAPLRRGAVPLLVVLPAGPHRGPPPAAAPSCEAHRPTSIQFLPPGGGEEQMT